MPTTTTTKPAAVIIPCGGAKVETTTTAAELYTGSPFRMALAAALNQTGGDRTMIFVLSALHGLVQIDETLAPYDVKMGDAEAIDKRPGGLVELEAQFVEHGLAFGVDVYAFLPSKYLAALEAATRRWTIVTPLYEDVRGIGEQKAILASARDN